MINEYWFPWFPATFRSATRHLTPYQDGLYRRLIDEYMTTREPIPNNDTALAGICRIGVSEFVLHAEILKAFFLVKGDLLYHNFCNAQLDIQDIKTKKRSEIGKHAAKKRWEINETEQEDKCIMHASRMPEAMHGDATGQDRTGQDKERAAQKSVSENAKLTPEGPENPLWFSGKIIRLNKRDYKNWLTIYPGTDEQFHKYLDDRDEWLFSEAPEKRKNWFMSTGRHIASLKTST